MGWGRMLLLGNVGQQFDIHDVQEAVEQMKGAVVVNEQVDRSQGDEIRRLKEENRELKLYLATLLKLLVAKGVLTVGETEAMVRGIDEDR
jgi:hypothetical protein